MSDTPHVHHSIDYIEFTVTDMTTSQKFYQAAFDWTFTAYGPDYAGIKTPGSEDGHEAGGFRLADDASVGGPLVVLFSTNLNDTLARVRSAGGIIVTEPFDFPGGRRFHFTDPSGTELAVYAIA